ncbi:MAG: alpha/beta hydrolase-fold protein [Xanthobacteraceae bacterium]
MAWIGRVVGTVAALACAAGGRAEPAVSEARRADNGFLVHTVKSEFQAGATQIFVRMPDKIAAGVRLPVLYLLPVEAHDGQKWGDARAEARKLDLANRLGAIVVYPTFSHLPWYADHPSDPHIRQERYFLDVVLPLVERGYPARAERDARLLLGFSKSGWGAWSLLLRRLDLFGKAAAWDAPMMLERGRYGMEVVSGSQTNFEQYRISTLLRTRGTLIGRKERLWLAGYDFYRAHTLEAHKLMRALAIPHGYRDGPRRRHHWNSGWVQEAARWLAR